MFCQVSRDQSLDSQDGRFLMDIYSIMIGQLDTVPDCSLNANMDSNPSLMPAGSILPFHGSMRFYEAAILLHLTAVTSLGHCTLAENKEYSLQSSSLEGDRCGFARPAPGVVRCIQLPPTKGIVPFLCLNLEALQPSWVRAKHAKRNHDADGPLFGSSNEKYLMCITGLGHGGEAFFVQEV